MKGFITKNTSYDSVKVTWTLVALAQASDSALLKTSKFCIKIMTAVQAEELWPKILFHGTKCCSYPVWVPGLRIDPLHLLIECCKRRLNQTPLNLRGLMWLLTMDCSKRENIRKKGPRGNHSTRTQLFAADRRTSHGSKKGETLRRQTEVPEETEKSTT